MYQDYLELLQLLNDFKVKYVVIGGYAVLHYTEPRYTKDLDILIEASSANAKKALKSLKKFGAPTDNLTEAELSKPGLIYIFGIPPIRVDMLNKAKGCSFENAWKSREKVKIKNVTVNFISRANLIKLKRASGRPQDLADLESLLK